MDKDTITMLGSALEDFGRAESVARGGRTNDGSFYTDLIEQRRKKAKDEAEAKRKQAIADFLSKEQDYKLKKQEREQSQWDELDNPESKTSQVTRAILSKRLKDMGVEDVEGMTAEQLKNLPIPDEKNRRSQFLKIQDDDGVVRHYRVNPDGTKEPVGVAGYAQRTYVDPDTGYIRTFNPSTGSAGGLRGRGGGSQPPQAAQAQPSEMPESSGVIVPNTRVQPGETPKQRDARVKLETKKAEAAIAKQSDKAKEMREMKEDLKKLSLMEKYLLENHAKSGYTGPIVGQAADVLRNFGYPTDKESTNFRTVMQLWANDYIKAISGAAVPEKEFRDRFAPILPKSGDTTELVADRMAGFKDYANILYGARDRGISPFPRKVRKDGKEATVSSEEELREAIQEGWR